MQAKVQIVVSTAMKLLLLTYYEVLEDACRMLAELVKVRPNLLKQILQPLADCLLDVYNGLPADRQPNLLKHVEKTLDFMALHLDVHTLMQARPTSPSTFHCSTTTIFLAAGHVHLCAAVGCSDILHVLLSCSAVTALMFSTVHMRQGAVEVKYHVLECLNEV